MAAWCGIVSPLAAVAVRHYHRGGPRESQDGPRLTQIAEDFKSFSKGRISYSKVRAMTRVATPKNEKFLLKIAHHGTAAHVEKVVSNYRRGKRLEILYEENNRHAHRELSWYMDGDGMWVFKGKFTAEQGALIATALEGAMDELFEEQRNEPSVSNILLPHIRG